MEVDLQRKRIALTMRLDEQPGEGPARRSGGPTTPAANVNKGREAPKRNAAPAASRGNGNAGNNAMADALAAAFKKR